MEELVGLFAEIFFEIFFELAGVIISKIAIDKRKRKITKYCISFFVFACCLALIIYSLIIKKMLYVQMIMIYFLILLFCYILEFINKNMLVSKTLERVLLYFKRGIHYAFPIGIIILVNVYKSKQTPIITSLACIVLVLYFGIILYRITYKNTYSSFKRKVKKYIRYYNNFNEKYLERLETIMKKDYNLMILFLKECSINEFKCMIQLLPNLEELYTQELYDILLNKAFKYNINLDEQLEKIKIKISNEEDFKSLE